MQNRAEQHYAIIKKPDFMDDSFKIQLTQASKELYERGQAGQGYIGLVDLETGDIHLMPAFNHPDGMLRADKEGNPFNSFEMVISKNALGSLTGDLHTMAASNLGLVNKAGRIAGGIGGLLLGFGIWKGGEPVKFLTQLPKFSGLIPREYLLIKEIQGWRFVVVDEQREIHQVNIDSVNGLRELINQLPANKSPLDFTKQDRKPIEDLLQVNYLVNEIKYFKDRSTSQNGNAVQYTKEFLDWFLMATQNHSMHMLNKERELPMIVMEKILKSVHDGLGLKPPESLLSETNQAIPRGTDGIYLHYGLENDWTKLQNILKHPQNLNFYDLRFVIKGVQPEKLADVLKQLGRDALLHVFQDDFSLFAVVLSDNKFFTLNEDNKQALFDILGEEGIKKLIPIGKTFDQIRLSSSRDEYRLLEKLGAEGLRERIRSQNDLLKLLISFKLKNNPEYKADYFKLIFSVCNEEWFIRHQINKNDFNSIIPIIPKEIIVTLSQAGVIFFKSIINNLTEFTSILDQFESEKEKQEVLGVFGKDFIRELCQKASGNEIAILLNQLGSESRLFLFSHYLREGLTQDKINQIFSNQREVANFIKSDDIKQTIALLDVIPKQKIKFLFLKNISNADFASMYLVNFKQNMSEEANAIVRIGLCLALLRAYGEHQTKSSNLSMFAQNNMCTNPEILKKIEENLLAGRALMHDVDQSQCPPLLDSIVENIQSQLSSGYAQRKLF